VFFCGQEFNPIIRFFDYLNHICHCLIRIIDVLLYLEFWRWHLLEESFLKEHEGDVWEVDVSGPRSYPVPGFCISSD
jgi:hypothetical protein